MPAPPAYLDECIDRPVVEALRTRGFVDWLGTLDDPRSLLFQWNDLQQLLLSGFGLPGYSEAEIDSAVGRSRDT